MAGRAEKQIDHHSYRIARCLRVACTPKLQGCGIPSRSGKKKLGEPHDSLATGVINALFAAKVNNRAQITRNVENNYLHPLIGEPSYDSLQRRLQIPLGRDL